jgi:hypothetical protein
MLCKTDPQGGKKVKDHGGSDSWMQNPVLDATCYILCKRLNETLSNARPKVGVCQRKVNLDVKINTLVEMELVLGPNMYGMHFGLL